jgi:hypothetical protein
VTAKSLFDIPVYVLYTSVGNFGWRNSMGPGSWNRVARRREIVTSVTRQNDIGGLRGICDPPGITVAAIGFHNSSSLSFLPYR